MSLDGRIKVPRVDRIGVRRRRDKVNMVERVWAYETIKQLTSKAIQSTDHTARAIILATVQQLASQVEMCPLYL